MQFSKAMNQAQDLVQQKHAGQDITPGKYTQLSNELGTDSWSGFLDAAHPGENVSDGLPPQQQAQNVVQMKHSGMDIPSGLYTQTANDLGVDPGNWQGFMDEAYPNRNVGRSQQQGSPSLDFGNMSDVGGFFDTARSQAQNTYSDIQGNINTAYSDAQDYLPHMMQQRLQPQLQQGMNQLAGRGMLDSSVASDALAQVSRGVSQDVLGQQAQLEGQRAQQLAGLGQQHQGLLGELASQQAGAQAQGHMAEYETLANMLPFLLENQVPGESQDGSTGGGGGSGGGGSGRAVATWEGLKEHNDSYKDIMGDIVRAKNEPNVDIEPGAYSYTKQQFNEQYPDYQVDDWETFKRYANT